jgi:hypothetical protein
LPAADIIFPGFSSPFSGWSNSWSIRVRDQAWGGTAGADNNAAWQGHRGTLFSGRFQISGDRGTQLLPSLGGGTQVQKVGVAIRSREDHSDEKITHHEVGWSPVRNHPVYVRGGHVSDWEESQVLAALAVSELPAALQ